ncbi:response regulator transcription factor [Sphingomonas floccifaciens]|uniref:Response regulator transcription factor n=1 Tax=Sphingomonas floccifaciens TaxID=1844115 RepID=A0ABW4NE80_9SPHN
MTNDMRTLRKGHRLNVQPDISIILVEDDGDHRAIIARFLRSAGMTVTECESVAELEQILDETSPDIVILDVNLPGESGFVAAARLRARSMLGIVMVTGRSEQADRLLGLSMGVDHYLAKPVDLRELESVIRNLAKRLGGPLDDARPAEPANKPVWVLNRTEWRLTAPNGGSVDLSSAEYTAFGPIIEQPGQVHSRDAINARLGKPRLDADNRSLDVMVSRIRRKTEAMTGQMLPLRAARGCGYVFTERSSVEDAVAHG